MEANRITLGLSMGYPEIQPRIQINMGLVRVPFEYHCTKQSYGKILKYARITSNVPNQCV